MNIVLVGYGYWGPNIARNLNISKEANLYAIVDKDDTKLEKAKNLYGHSVRYDTNYRIFLMDENVDGFAVALRNDIGTIVARDILTNGKHLFMEKPLAASVKDAEELQQKAIENNLILHTDHILVFNPVIKKIKEIIDSGEMGELIFFDSSRVNLGPHIKNDINVMWDLAIHDLAVLDYLIGGKEPINVKAIGLDNIGEKQSLTYLSLKYENIVAFIKSSWISPLKERVMVIGGTKKMIVFDDLKNPEEKLMIYDKGIDFKKNDFSEYGKYEAKVRIGDLYVPYIEPEDALLNSLEHFIECIKTNTQSHADANQAIRILKILQKADKDLI